MIPSEWRKSVIVSYTEEKESGCVQDRRLLGNIFDVSCV